MLRHLPIYGLALLGVGFLVMTPLSYTSYSSVGLDSEWLREPAIVHYYARLRWPGDGTFRCGNGVLKFDPAEEDIDRLDLAGDFFTKRELKTHRPARWGFGYWNSGEYHDTRHGDPAWGYWLSMPAWLPAALLLASGLLWRAVRNDGSSIQ